jgi:hypothetical protein
MAWHSSVISDDSIELLPLVQQGCSVQLYKHGRIFSLEFIGNGAFASARITVQVNDWSVFPLGHFEVRLLVMGKGSKRILGDQHRRRERTTKFASWSSTLPLG